MVKGSHMTDEQKAMASLARKEAWNRPGARAEASACRTGRVDSLETRMKKSAAQKIAQNRPEVKTKISATLIGNTRCLGHKASPETSEKKSIAQKEVWTRPEVRAKMFASHWKGGPKIFNAKKCAKRRTLGFVPLNASFDGADAHHVSKEYVVYIPKDLHCSIRHNIWNGRNMEQINLLALGYLVRQLEVAA